MRNQPFRSAALRSAASPAAGRHASPEAGFTLVEMLVATLLSSVLILGILAVFEANSRVSRVQSDLADMQQAQRVGQHEMVRYARMAGRGGLPRGTLPLGISLQVRNNVGTTEYISPGDNTTPAVLDATDVLTLRGVLSGSVYQISYASPGTFTYDSTSGTGTIRVVDPTVTSIPQDLEDVITAINDGRPEAMILVSPLSDAVYSVVELDPGNSSVNSATDVTIAFTTQGTLAAQYNALSPSGVFSNELGQSGAAYMGILEEYRYYIEELRIGADLETQLSRARVYPNTENLYPEDNTWSTVIATDVHDLQLAIGIDEDGDGLARDGLTDTTVTANADEWLFNDAADNVNDAKWNTAPLAYLRITTLAVAPRDDRQYEAPALQSIEDRSYSGSYLNTSDWRKRRRRSVDTWVDLRNLG